MKREGSWNWRLPILVLVAFVITLPALCYGHDPTIESGYDQFEFPIDITDEPSAKGEREVVRYHFDTAYSKPSDDYTGRLIKTVLKDLEPSPYRGEEVGWC